jgi:hypothetical protein
LRARLAEPDGEALLGPSQGRKNEMPCPIGDRELDRDQFAEACAVCGRCRTIAVQVWPAGGGVSISEWRVTDTGHHLFVTYSADEPTEIIKLRDARAAAEVFEDAA